MLNTSTEAASLDGLFEQEEWLHGLARQLTVDDASARDLVQQTWVAALRNPPRDLSWPRAWLATVIRRLAATKTRRFSPVPDDFPARGPSPIEAVLKNEDGSRLRVAVTALDEQLRTSLLLRFGKGMTQAEIADHLGVTERTVRYRIDTACAQLRQNLGEGFRDESRPAAWRLILAPFLDGNAKLRASGAAVTPAGGLLVFAVIAAGLLALVLGRSMWTGLGRSASDEVAVGRLDLKSAPMETKAPGLMIPTALRASRDTVPAETSGGAGSLLATKSVEASQPNPVANEAAQFWVLGQALIDGKVPEGFEADVIPHGWMPTHPVIPEHRCELTEDGSFSVAAAETGLWALLIRPETRTTGSPAYRILLDLAPGNEEQEVELNVATGSVVINFDGHEGERVWLWSPSNSWEYICTTNVKDGTVTGHLVPVGEVRVLLRPDKRMKEYDQFLRVGSGWVNEGETTTIQALDVH